MTALRVLAIVAVLSIPSGASGAQAIRQTVVDQTGSALPGATVQLLDGSAIVATVTTDAEGTFAFDDKLPGATIVVSLSGFETTRVRRADAARVTLALARTTESTTVVAPIGGESSPSGAALGHTLTATDIARLPSKNMKARESLPLLPAVMRGQDGLLQLGGARPHDTPLLLDGFNVTDPATGISSINLPYEASRGVEVLRDPMAVTDGDLLGGLVTLESRPGGDKFTMGVQGVVPRPRFSSPGFGRLEGIFPRIYLSGKNASGRFRYSTAVEYDYERIPVPGVTQGKGPDVVEQSTTAFLRLDGKLNQRQSLTVEALVFPGDTQSQGLSPRREQAATFDFGSRDIFVGLTHRYIAGEGSVFTVRVSALAHRTTLTPNGEGPSLLSPAGWSGNWFARADRTAARYNTILTWERVTTIGGRVHDITFSAEVSARDLSGRISESPITVQDAEGRVVRTIDFGPPSDLHASDRRVALLARDVWKANARTQVDAGVRVDQRRHSGTAFSSRIGVRYALDDAGVTVIKAGYGGFVGTMPLGVPAFAGYPTRLDRRFNPETGDMTSQIELQPRVGVLSQPRALAATFTLERQLMRSVDLEVVLTSRQSSNLATLRVPTVSGPLQVESTGTADYREAQFSVRRVWAGDQQVFVSYVRSSGRGEINDFTSLFGFVDAPLLQPGAKARLSSEARNRVIAWGTVNLPRRIVLSPVTEWRSGFPYSVLDNQYVYLEAPNSREFPNFWAIDLVTYKTFTVKKRSADLGVQIFNLTDHKNPRDVYAVSNAPHFGEFTNSVGTIFRGYMLVKW